MGQEHTTPNYLKKVRHKPPHLTKHALPSPIGVHERERKTGAGSSGRLVHLLDQISQFPAIKLKDRCRRLRPLARDTDVNRHFHRGTQQQSMPVHSPKGSIGPGVNLDLILWLRPGAPKVLQHVVRAQLRIQEVGDTSLLRRFQFYFPPSHTLHSPRYSC